MKENMKPSLLCDVCIYICSALEHNLVIHSSKNYCLHRVRVCTGARFMMTAFKYMYYGILYSVLKRTILLVCFACA